MMALLLGLTLSLPSSSDTLSAVDLYGLRSVSEAAVRSAVRLQPGDPTPASTEPVRARVAALDGVSEADVSVVCCGVDGGSILFVGVREEGEPGVPRRPAPDGEARLPPRIFALAERFHQALERAVRQGSVQEDFSHGYSLSGDADVRAVQERLLLFASERYDTVVAVLRTSSDPKHRAWAAVIAGYGADRGRAARELVRALHDPSEDVRNNAARGLGVLGRWANEHPAAGVEVPAKPLVALLNSVSWSDRNKAAFGLMALTEARDPALLESLQDDALPSLVEMARWTDPGYALVPLIILARMAGLEDGEAFRALLQGGGDREDIIARAQRSAR